ncbi:MAG: tyrosine-type recombinase/integrase [Acidobacteria bacterium]|nr:tyrosine-type recombinase/integrase [Acidobacteriota bacterium]
MTNLVLSRPTDEASTPKDALIKLVTDTLSSEHTCRAYTRALSDFLDWYQTQGAPPLQKSVVAAYVAELREAKLSPANINQRLSAIKKLVTEAADNHLLNFQNAEAIHRVKGVRSEGRKTGNWLTRDDAQALLSTPSKTSTTESKGLRDRAILAITLGGGLRRSELVNLRVEMIRQLDGRWVIADLTGKRGRTRTVPIPAWTKVAVDAWTEHAGITDGVLFRSIDRHGNIGASMTSQAIHFIVTSYANEQNLSSKLTPHDLRRTFAKLAHKGGSPIDQIQLTLGHESIKTTEIYLGVQQNLTHAPCDVLGLTLEKEDVHH